MQTSGYLFIWHESITALQPDGGPGNCCVLEDFPQWNTAVLLGVTTTPSITPGAGEKKGGVDFIWISLALSFPFSSLVTTSPMPLGTLQPYAPSKPKGYFHAQRLCRTRCRDYRGSTVLILSVLLNYGIRYSCCNADQGSGHQQDMQAEAHQNEGQLPIKSSSC